MIKEESVACDINDGYRTVVDFQLSIELMTGRKLWVIASLRYLAHQSQMLQNEPSQKTKSCFLYSLEQM